MLRLDDDDDEEPAGLHEGDHFFQRTPAPSRSCAPHRQRVGNDGQVPLSPTSRDSPSRFGKKGRS